MKYALLFFYLLCFLGSVAYAQVPATQDQIVTPLGLAPVSTSYQPPPAKTDDVLPIAPMRTDERVEMPETVFSSINKNEMWERFERGENLKGTSSSATMLANDKPMKDKERKPSSVKGVKNKTDKKVKVAKVAKTGNKKNAKAAKKTSNKTAKSSKNTKRKPSSKK